MSYDRPNRSEALATLEGELSVAPRSSWLIALLAVTGLLLLLEVLRLVGRLVLALRRPAVVRLTDTAIEVRGSTRLLGRVIREHLTIVPREALIHATREVRYPRLGLYAGLIALTVGSYVGVGLLVDGVRAASPSLFGTGVLIVLLGLAFDFAFSSAIPGLRGHARLLLLPRRGPAVCLSAVETDAADRFLAELARGLPRVTGSPDAVGAGGGADGVASESERKTAEQT
jgi:hypothetical protein